MSADPTSPTHPVAPAAAASAVLHLTAAAGGGVDRYIRDIAASSARPHLIWHVGASVDVLEHPRGHFLPLTGAGSDAAGAVLTQWVRAAGTGLVHLHGISDECRARVALLERSLALPYVVTLHDVSFVNPHAFEIPGMPERDPAWIATIAGTLRRAAAVIAPSTFIRDLAVACVPGLAVEVVAPGVRPASAAPVPAAPADFTAAAPARIVAVVGAIGPHKGSRILDALVEALAGSDIGIVVIGYTDTQIARGWLVPGRYYVHGPYVDDALAGWLAAYRAAVVLFPNRLPESFSYTLSEVWSQGLPVVVPDEGALGDRVAQHGGGWRLPAAYDAADAARLLARVLSAEGAAEYASVKSQVSRSDPARVPPLDAMVHDLDAVYARFALPATASTPDSPPELLAPLLAANLDGFNFRQELVRLIEELANARAAVADGTAWAAKLERDLAEVRAWARKLERDVAEIQAAAGEFEIGAATARAWATTLERDVVASEARVKALERQLGETQAALDASQTWALKLEADVATLNAELVEQVEQTRRMADEKAAFDLRLAQELGASRAWVVKLEGDVAGLNAALSERVEQTRRMADDKAAFDLLPEVVRKLLLKRVFRGRR
jgi:glycosyltransferase involved in cell wall biosynthesis